MLKGLSGPTMYFIPSITDKEINPLAILQHKSLCQCWVSIFWMYTRMFPFLASKQIS